MPRPEKVQSVQEIAGRFRESEAALLTEYRGLHVSDIAEVRSALREADADYKVLKNTLARIAVREVGLDELVDMLEGPTAIAFCNGDAVPAAKALDEAARKFPVLIIKGGVLQGKVIGSDQARKLATLESREIQLGKIVTLVNTPLQQMVNVLAAPLRDLGSMLAQVVAKKGSGELEAGELSSSSPPETGASSEAADEAETVAGNTSPDGTDSSAAGDAQSETAPESPQPEVTASSEAEAGDAQPESAPQGPQPEAETEPPAAPSQGSTLNGGADESTSTQDDGDRSDAADAAGSGMEE